MLTAERTDERLTLDTAPPFPEKPAKVRPVTFDLSEQLLGKEGEGDKKAFHLRHVQSQMLLEISHRLERRGRGQKRVDLSSVVQGMLEIGFDMAYGMDPRGPKLGRNGEPLIGTKEEWDDCLIRYIDAEVDVASNRAKVRGRTQV